MSNIVLLIDADNANAKYIDEVMNDLQKRGELRERLIFGDWSNPALSSWNNAILKHALKQNQQNSYVKGKNATDIAMVIAAMELLYTKEQIDAFAIMSSDSDFTPLVQKLRQENKNTIGFVKDNTSESFKQACNEIVVLSNQENTDIQKTMRKTDDVMQVTQVTHQVLDNKVKKKILSIIEQLMNEGCKDGFVSSAIIGQAFSKNNIAAKDFGCKTLKELLGHLSEIEITFVQEKSNYYYRLKNCPKPQQKTEIKVVKKVEATDRKEKINNSKKLLDKINQAFDELSINNEWLAVSLLGSKLGGADYSLQTKNYGYKNWSKLFQDLENYEKKMTKNGHLMVRKSYVKENKKAEIARLMTVLSNVAYTKVNKKSVTAPIVNTITKNKTTQTTKTTKKSRIVLKDSTELFDRITQAINHINPNGFVRIIDVNDFLRKEYGAYTYQYFSGSTADFMGQFPQKFEFKSKLTKRSANYLCVRMIR